MNCALTQEQQIKFLKKVAKDLIIQKDSGKTFSFKNYSKELYDLVNNKTGDKALALNYVSLLPTFINKSLSKDISLAKYLVSELPQIYKLDEMSVAEIEEFLGLSDNTAESLEQANKLKIEEIVKEAEETISNEEVKKIEEALLSRTKVGTLNHSFGEVVTLGVLDRSGVETKPKALSSDKVYPALKTKINWLEKHKDTDKYDFNYKAKAVKGETIPIENFRTSSEDSNDSFIESVKRALEGNNPSEQDLKNLESYKNGVVIVVTDKAGFPQKFDENGNESFEGNYVIFNTLPRIITQEDVDNQVTDKRKFVQQAPSLSKLTGIKKERLQNFRRYINQQIKNIRDAVNQGNTVMLDISKINGGFVDIKVRGEYGQEQVVKPTSEFVEDLKTAQGGFTLEKHKDGGILLVPNTLSYKKEDITNSLLTRNLLTPEQISTFIDLVTTPELNYESASGVDFKLSLSRRKELLFLYKRLGNTNIPQIVEKIKKDEKFFKIDLVKSDNKEGYKVIVRVGKEITEYNPTDKALKEFLQENLKKERIYSNTGLLNKTYPKVSVEGNSVIEENPNADYNQFIIDNTSTALYIPEPTSPKLNQTIYFDISDNQFDLTKPDDQTEEPIKVETALPKQRRKLIVPNESGSGLTLDKSKLIENHATPEQIKKAKEWYNKSPISKYVPFEEMFLITNSKAFATFNKNGIRLYKGANYTDLYHEAFHAFSQLFLTKDQKLDLYKELKKKPGSFTNYKGNKVKYSEASYLEIEELLAEDFRLYVLSEGKNVLKESPKRNSIFRKILNFLKYVFGSTSYKDYIANINNLNVNSKVKEIYDALYTGNIIEEQFSLDNSLFEDLNSARIENKTETDYEFTEKESNLILKSLDNVLGEFIQNKVDTEGAKWSTAFYRNPLYLLDFYKYAGSKFAEQAKLIDQQLLTEKDPNKIKELESQYELISRALEQWTPSKDVISGKEKKGTVYFHKQYSELLNFKDQIIDEALINKATEKEDVVDYKLFDKAGNELSTEEYASEEIIFLVKSLLDSEGTVDTLGFRNAADFKKIWFNLNNTLKDELDFPTMIDKLREASNKIPEFSDLIKRLGNLDTSNSLEYRNQTRFWDAFNKANIKLISMNIDTNNEETKLIMGSTSSRRRNVVTNLNNDFKTTKENPFIKQNEDGVNYLDKESVVEKFKNPTSEGFTLNPSKKIEFLNAIGIPLEKSEEVSKSVNKLYVENLYNFLYTLSNHNPNYVDKIERLGESEVVFTNLTKSFGSLYKTFGITGTSAITGHQSGLITKLIDLYIKTSQVETTFTVTTAENEMRQELSSNSSLHVLVNQLNKAKSFVELYQTPEFKHFDPKVNPKIKNLEMLQRLFDFNNPKAGYPKKGNLKLSDLSGLQKVVDGNFESGLATAKLDKTSKLIYDVHAMLEYFMPELMRHADKSQSLSLTIGDLYIKLDAFNSDQADAEVVKYFHKYLDIELNRIQNKDKYAGTGLYEKQAGEFLIFKDILNEDTQNKLKEFKEDFINSETGLVNRKKLKDFSPSLLKSINDQIISYLNKKSEEFNQVYQNKYISESLSQNIEAKNIAKAHMANTLIHNLETLYLVYGDPAQFNHLKDEFHKRNAPIASGGRLMRTDKYALKHVNEKLTTPYQEGKKASYAEKLGFKTLQIKEDKVLGTAVFDDVEIPSAYLSKYENSFYEFYKSKNIPDSKAKELAKESVDAYSEMNTGDAQGYMTIDAYKALALLSGRWTDKQNDLYNKLINNEYVDPLDISEFFPPRKYQYYGPLSSEVSATALHKYSLLPLIPQLIEGTNLETLNKRLMKQELGIGMFKSASKITTLSNKADVNKLYNEEGGIITEGNFTNNPIILSYLKDQVDTHFTFKNKVNFPSQIRKLILSGLYSSGKPKNDEAKRLVENYEKSLRNLQKLKKKELYKEMNWTEGSDSNSLENLISFLKKELSREDLADHELEELNITNSKDLIIDLSLSPSAAKIEKVITSLINRRLVKYFTKGEGLVQASSILSESKSLSRNFKKPTQEQIEEFGSNDLRSYEIENGKIRSMEVKIALQGDFLRLLKLKHTDGSEIRTRNRLNEMMRNSEWKKKYQKMLTMVGVRIPTQELNSMEVMEIKEFLDPSAGNILMAPLELVAKTGSDFDIDKMFTLMPNITMFNEELDVDYTEESLKEVYDNRITKAFKREEEFTEEEINEIYKENKIPFTFEEFKDKYNTRKAENELLFSMTDIIQFEDNFINLIKPLDGQEVKDLATKKLSKYNNSRVYSKNATKIIEPLYNLDKHQANNIGKDALGIGAVFNTYNALLNRWGAEIEKHYGLENSEIDYLLNTPKKDLTKRQIEDLEKILDFQIYLPINMNNGKIDFSSEYDSENKYRIGDLISQLMNGWVDIAKDSWVFDIQGNKEVAPVLMTMLKLGVPLELAGHFVTSPIIKEYAEMQRYMASPFHELIEGISYEPFEIKDAARDNILKSKALNFAGSSMFKKMQNYVKLNLESFGKLSTEDKIKKLVDNYKTPDSSFNKAIFMYYLQFEALSSDVTKLTQGTNFDTTVSPNMFDSFIKDKTSKQLKTKSMFTTETLNKITRDSLLNDFNISNDISNIVGSIFKIRNNIDFNDAISNILARKPGITKKTYGDKSKTAEVIKDDLMVHVIQKEISGFEGSNIESYKSYAESRNLNFKEFEANNERAVQIKDGTLFVDIKNLKEQFKVESRNHELFRQDGIFESFEAFKSNGNYNFDLFAKFVIELNYLKSVSTKGETESFEAFNKRLTREALHNNFNLYHMFSSKNDNLSRKIFDIIKQHPELKQYDLINNLTPTSNLVREKIGYNPQTDRDIYSSRIFYNIELKTQKLKDIDLINKYYREFKELADPSYKKVENEADNKKISDLFNKLIYFSIFQSGYNSSGNYALSRITPKEDIKNIILQNKEYIKDIQTNLADNTFMSNFVTNNSNKQKRYRFKDYTGVGLKDDNNAEILTVEEPTQPSTSVNPADFTNYHGGAKKYDTYWEQEGKTSGVTKHIAYTVDSYDKLDQATKDKLDVKYEAARTWLGRSSLSKDIYSGRLVRRDMMQAAKADGIFAVSEIVAPGTKGRKGYINKTNHPIIEGGTGYAVASGILLNKPVYVFNQDSNYGYDTGWYKWDSSTNNFVKTDIPVLTKNYAGIGSSTNETEIGRQAIRDVYANTFKATTQLPTSAVVKPVLIKGSKIINAEDVNTFNNYLSKSGGVLPKEFFTSKTVFDEFFNFETGKKEKAPNSSKWMLNSNNLYDLIDKESGEVYIKNVDLRTGIKMIEDKIDELPGLDNLPEPQC